MQSYKYMKRMMFLSMLLSVFMVIPITVSAENYSIEYKGINFICPVNNRILGTLLLYNHMTDFGFDNFTITNLEVNISSTSLLDVRFSKLSLIGYNSSTMVEVFRGQSMQFNLTEDDLLDQKVYNSSISYYRQWNGTYVITYIEYYIIIPFFLFEMENIGNKEALIHFDREISVETNGFWEAEVVVEPYNSTITIPVIGITSQNDITNAEYWREILLKNIVELIIIFFIGGFVLAVAIGDKFNL